MRSQSVQPLIDQAKELHLDALDLYHKLNFFLGQSPAAINISASAIADAQRLSDVLYDFSGHSGFYHKIKQSGDACRHPSQSSDVLGEDGTNV